VERDPALHRRAVGKVAHRVRRIGRGPRERLSRNGPRPHVTDGLYLGLRPSGHESLGRKARVVCTTVGLPRFVHSMSNAYKKASPVKASSHRPIISVADARTPSLGASSTRSAATDLVTRSQGGTTLGNCGIAMRGRSGQAGLAARTILPDRAALVSEHRRGHRAPRFGLALLIPAVLGEGRTRFAGTAAMPLDMKIAQEHPRALGFPTSSVSG